MKDLTPIKKEFEFKFVRSTGPGGQNVNKTNSAVQLRWNLWNSVYLSEVEKQRIHKLYSSQISVDGDFVLKSNEFRDQPQNLAAAIEKMLAIIEQGLIIPKKRIKTKPSRASKMRRLDNKKKRGEVKKLRRNDD